MSAGEWTEAHRREARVEALRLAMLAMSADENRKSWLLANVFGDDVGRFGAGLLMAGLTADEVQVAIRRVRGLAEGRLVRETDAEYRVLTREGKRPRVAFVDSASGKAAAVEWAKDCRGGGKAIRVKVTRIRRSS